MQRIVLIFGLLSGLIIATLMALSLALQMGGDLDFENSGEVVGYSSMVLSFLLVFFGIRSYREKLGGSISFGKAFKVGILITVIACAFYVVTWEIVYFNFIPDFFDKYTVHVVDKMRREGKPDAEILAKQKQMKDFEKLYKNPFINAAVTFMEPFPVGLIMTLVSAAILRRKPGAPPALAHAAIA